jgi:hypothetical protein
MKVTPKVLNAAIGAAWIVHNTANSNFWEYISAAINSIPEPGVFVEEKKESKMEWINVKVRMPKLNDLVLFWVNGVSVEGFPGLTDGYAETGSYRNYLTLVPDCGDFRSYSGDRIESEWWMPFPAPPGVFVEEKKCKNHRWCYKEGYEGVQCDWCGEHKEATMATVETVIEMSGVDLIAAERRRQVVFEGWTPEHDDDHEYGELAIEAACLAVDGTDAIIDHPEWDENQQTDPWGLVEKHRNNRVRQLVIAGALLAAEIDRQQRLAVKKNPTREEEIAQILVNTLDSTNLPAYYMPVAEKIVALWKKK